jgi:aquaporin related protein
MQALGVYYTGGSLNPARSLGPDIVSLTFNSYHWIYWLGPTLGSILAVVFYRFIKYLEYETVNPGQDFDEHEHSLFNPSQDPASPAEVRRPNITAYYTSSTVASLEGGHIPASSASRLVSKQQEIPENIV